MRPRELQQDSMIGKVFGNWIVLSLVGTKGKGGNFYFLCKCSCGKLREVSGTNLRLGKTSSCKSCSSKINGKLGHVSRKHLYMVQCGPYIKIGSTDNIHIRLSGLRAYNPYPIKLVGYWEDYGHKEKEWHMALNHLHHSGEWFLVGNSCELS